MQRQTAGTCEPKAACLSWGRSPALEQQLWNAEAGGLDRFVLPMMLGSIGELRPLQFKTPDRHYGASITLIARRSVQRVGTRHWRRGADNQVHFTRSHCCVLWACCLIPPHLSRSWDKARS